MSADLSPDNDELLQEEEHGARMTPIPVVVEGTVRVQQLPRRNGAVVQMFLDSTGGNITPVRILGEDPRRASAIVLATDQKIRIGTSQKQVLSPDMCVIWPANTPFPWNAADALWVAADTATTRCSASIELWGA